MNSPSGETDREREDYSDQDREREKEHEQFIESVGTKARRRMRARRQANFVWFGLGTFGMVGWSVAIPTLIGIAVGAWLEANVPVGFSWRLTMLVVGLAVGCLNAWYWVNKEQRAMAKEREEHEQGEHEDDGE